LRIVDLRSDTLTIPTKEMRDAMYNAEVGDDVYGEDPTVNKLEKLGAEITGKEDALFVSSGTMGNQIAIMAQTNKGDEIICESESHIFYYELAGISCLAGVQSRQVKGVNGILSSEIITKAIRPQELHQPRTSVISLENTHNRGGGTCYSKEALKEIKTLSQDKNIKVHMDGARVFNAAIAKGVALSEIAQYTDSLTFCLSKGLGAPVGSLLVGSSDFIAECRRYRKMLGGGMRQAGILAAAGIIAIERMPQRLHIDHENAKLLAEKLKQLGFGIDEPQTNIVLADSTPLGLKANELSTRLLAHGIKTNVFGEYIIRFVTYNAISQDDIYYTSEMVAKALSNNKY
jgi:threonine aldolase